MGLSAYRQIFQNTSFRAFWLGFTFSDLGDAMTRVALTWYVYERTQSSEAIGWLLVCYTGPVIVGGFLSGALLDRFDRRRVMFADNLIRGLAMLMLPVLSALGTLELWHVYVAAAVYGFLMMISLAGGPSLIPSLVDEDQFATANALETISFTLAGVVGPVIAGFLIAGIGAANVIIADALSYFAFAGVLLKIRLKDETPTHQEAAQEKYGLRHAVHLLVKNPVLLSTTIMFMMANIGLGFLAVWLPILSDQVLAGGAGLYGALLGLMAVGETVSSVIAGGRKFSLPLGTLICLAQGLSGAAVGVMVAGPRLWTVGIGLVLLGLFSAPLTIWAQTLRMQIIPEYLRGHTFSLLRMMMQSGGPLGGAIAGPLLPVVGIPAMIVFSAVLIGIPGVVGYQVRGLRSV